jgi:hypothetical protein
LIIIVIDYFVKLLLINAVLLNPIWRCFSTGGPQPSGGPRSSFGGPQVLSNFIENKNFKHKFHTQVLKDRLFSHKSNQKQQNKLILAQLPKGLKLS